MIELARAIACEVAFYEVLHVEHDFWGSRTDMLHLWKLRRDFIISLRYQPAGAGLAVRMLAEPSWPKYVPGNPRGEQEI